MRNVVSSAAESEMYVAFNTYKTAIGIRPALILLDHKQAATPQKGENLTTEGFVNSGIKSKCSKTWYMKLHCLNDKKLLEKLRLYWDKGKKKALIILRSIILQLIVIKCDLGIYIHKT